LNQLEEIIEEVTLLKFERMAEVKAIHKDPASREAAML
jgi:hypothetical protein